MQNVTIINTYMPTSKCKDKTTDYSSVLDEVFEITSKYINTTVLWMGDMNAAFNREHPSENDILFKNFCKETGFKQPPLTPNCPTYHHFVGGITSQIDHILELSQQSSIIKDIGIKQREPLNVSSHDAVYATLNVTPIQVTKLGENNGNTGNSVPNRPKWKNIDKDKYQKLTDEKLTIHLRTDDNLPVEVMLDRIHNILHSSQKEATTKKKNGPKQKRRHIWPTSIMKLIKNSKSCYAKWKAKKSPPKDDPVSIEYRAAKKELRSAQRQILAIQRKTYLENITETCHTGDVKFFSLVKKQQTKCAPYIQFNEETNDELEGWVNYFTNLATPSVEDHFDEDYFKKIQFKKLLIHEIAKTETDLPKVTNRDVEKFIQNLKNNKAPDVYGITSEHLKFASPQISTLMTKVINKISKDKTIPDLHKLGVVTPVPKKEKSACLPDNYRRITVTPTTGKITDMLVQHHSKPAYDRAQNPLQRGFTEKASSVNAELLLTEVLAESRDNKEPVYIQFLDARKAFDVVWHDGMLCSLHDQGITGPLWCLHESTYDSIKSCVKWKGEISKTTIKDQQGLRQGGLTSADCFKTKENPLLDKIEDSSDAYHIGSINVGAPTCADDIAICSKTLTGAKLLNDIAIRDSCKQRYIYSSTKSKIMIGNPNAVCKMQLELFPVSLIHEPMMETTNETHLGIHRNPKDKGTTTVQTRIKSSRRATYSMMGAGLHGLNGLNPAVSMKLIDTYILPKLLHGLDAIILTDTDIALLEKYYRNLLRQIQHLADNTANEAVYLLLGALPIEGHIHIRILSLFNRIAKLPNSKEWSIVRRQLATKDFTSHSWVIYVRKILMKYQLPSAFVLFESSMGKDQFESTIKKPIQMYWLEKLVRGCNEKSSLEFFNTHACTIGHPHPVYNINNTDTLYVHMNVIKVRLLTQRYNLHQSSMSKNKDKPCPVCHSDLETLHHFLYECDTSRCKLTVSKMIGILENNLIQHPIFDEEHYPWYTHLILDPSCVCEKEDVINELNVLSTKYVFQRHNSRAISLGLPSRYAHVKKCATSL